MLAIFPFLILKWGYEGAMTSLLSVSKPLAPLGECWFLFDTEYRNYTPSYIQIRLKTSTRVLTQWAVISSIRMLQRRLSQHLEVDMKAMPLTLRVLMRSWKMEPTQFLTANKA